MPPGVEYGTAGRINAFEVPGLRTMDLSFQASESIDLEVPGRRIDGFEVQGLRIDGL